jgi:hypothetical protein
MAKQTPSLKTRLVKADAEHRQIQNAVQQRVLEISKRDTVRMRWSQLRDFLPEDHSRVSISHFASLIISFVGALAPEDHKRLAELEFGDDDARNESIEIFRLAQKPTNRAKVINRLWAIATRPVEHFRESVFQWLRFRLPRQIQGIQAPPLMPPGWEGPYPKAIETQEDLVAWLDEQLAAGEQIGRVLGGRSDGSRVRNAYRLLDRLQLRVMGPEPSGPFELEEEFGILRELKRRIKDSLGQGKGEAGSSNKADMSDDGDSLPPCRKKAYSQYLWALEQNSELKGATDRQVYAWLEQKLESDERLPSLNSWLRYVRDARRAMGTNKHTSRAGRSGRSIVRSEQIDRLPRIEADS